MLLLTGPPGSGKTFSILDRFTQTSKGRPESALLLVPTATMAGHLRNELARHGQAFRPRHVSTLSRFLASFLVESNGHLTEVTTGTLEVLVAEALERLRPPEFQQVSDFNGFRATLSALLEECSAAGCRPETIASLTGHRLASHGYPGALADIFLYVENKMDQRAVAFRRSVLQLASEHIRQHGVAPLQHFFLDGFFSFTNPELDLIDALSTCAELTITLPDWDGASETRAALRRSGFPEQKCIHTAPRPNSLIVATGTVDREVEEIARRILAQIAKGHLFRDIGIIVRDLSYLPLLGNALDRFGIPGRYYFGEKLSHQPVIRYFLKIVEALESGWGHELTLEALRMSFSGFAGHVSDRFDCNVRTQLPRKGLDQLLTLSANGALQALTAKFRNLEPWRSRWATAGQWAADLKHLRRLVRVLEPPDHASHTQLRMWRAETAALNAFEAALDEAAVAIGPSDLASLAQFWQTLQIILENTALRVADHRRNVVHVFDVYEARQWRLPVVFVCGLLENQFPRYHAQDAVLPDAARAQLRQAGLHLSTSAERQNEEKFLFELATTRASAQLVLTYPQRNPQGEETLPSFYLSDFSAKHSATSASAVEVRPLPSYSGIARRHSEFSGASIYDEVLRGRLREKHKILAPTSIESYLQCPFQFFAGKTLRLKEFPCDPDKRLDLRTQGSLLHKVLAEWHRNPQPPEPLFQRIFEDECTRLNVVQGYRTEALRAEILRNLRMFLQDESFPHIWETQSEIAFTFDLDGVATIRGRIDRMDVAPDGQALIVDYKYSTGARIRKNVKQNENGQLVQAGLYMLAAKKELKVTPVGMFYCGLRKTVEWDGWHVPLPGFEKLGEVRRPEDFKQLLDDARQLSIVSIQSILDGRIAPDPAEKAKCAWCSYSDACRIETTSVLSVNTNAPGSEP